MAISNAISGQVFGLKCESVLYGCRMLCYWCKMGWLYINPMILLIDNSDSPSIVEQLQQGHSLDYYIFISDCS